MTKLSVRKFSATGNSFVLLDLRETENRRASQSVLPRLAQWLSAEFASDGLVVLGARGEGRMVFYNPDGSRAFCGNGTRRSGFYQIWHKRQKSQGDAVVVTDAGSIVVRVKGDEAALTEVELPRLIEPDPIDLPSSICHLPVYLVWAGCPHAVLFVRDAQKEDVVGVGRAIRPHERFKPGGTNVDFVQILSPHEIKVRTYERGVERETKSCGSGVMASAYLARALGKVKGERLNVQTQGGRMFVRFNGQSLAMGGRVEELFNGFAFVR